MWRAAAGLARSLAVYRSPRHLRSLTNFLREVAPGARRVIDVGAHAGDRVAAFRRLGAEVVAVEPQALMARWLRFAHGRDAGVRVVEAACGAAPGTAVLRVNRRNPTVSTLSEGFLRATRGAAGWEGQVWDGAAEVPVTTLDVLIAEAGGCDFVKIDVEGFEAEVLSGLSAASAPPRLSFEITTADRAAGAAALERAISLGYKGFRLTLGESHAWEGGWLDGAGMAARLADLPEAANSGDVVCDRKGVPQMSGF